MSSQKQSSYLSRKEFLTHLGVTIGLSAAGSLFYGCAPPSDTPGLTGSAYLPNSEKDTSGFVLTGGRLVPWSPGASLKEIGDAYAGISDRLRADMEKRLAQPGVSPAERIKSFCTIAVLHNYDGNPDKAYPVLEQARKEATADPDLANQCLYTIIYLQGITGLRQGENENCVLCIGDSACILPIVPAAVHKKPDGSRLAIKHFTEYLQQFPEDLAVRWLLNLAHMTLGEHPQHVDPRYLVSLDHYTGSDFSIGRFHDIAARVGINRLNEAGGAIMEDFRNCGFLDIVVTTQDPTGSMAYFKNKGDGTFEDHTEAAGLADQLGGLYCVQTDYNNDGNMDIFVTRGAWYKIPTRPSLLRNNGDGTFTDVTREAGLIDAVTSNCACWADYDNDGFLDLFICCETQPNKLYHNNGDGTFTEVAHKAGVAGYGGFYKAATWIDYDNNGYPDLFVSNLNGSAELYHNNGDGTFKDVTQEMGIDGPERGFSCWAFDYDNDGYIDIFATSYDKSVAEVVQGLLGKPHTLHSNKLFHNKQGKGFEDVTREAGLDMVFETMGCNFGDFDNDGYLDMYLGTGDPDYATLVPNRMFKNVEGKRFVEITASAGVGNLQKGHGVACGDWDNDGNVDIFIEMGGAVPGDKFRNLLFQNPGQGNNSLTVKLVGKKTNRAAVGARIKLVTDEATPRTIHRHVSSGSSFGANPLQQTIGVGKAQKVATLEIYWPTSKTTQVFHDIAVNQFIEITEFEKTFRKLERKRITLPV